VIPEVVWTGGGLFNDSCNGCGFSVRTTNLATIPSGLITRDTPVLVAVMTDNPGSFSSGAHNVEVVLPDSTVILMSRLDSIGLPGSPTGGAYFFAIIDPRLAAGGTLRSSIHLISVLAPDTKAGSVYAALLDMSAVPGQTPSLARVGFTGPGDTSNPLPITLSADPAPYLGFAMVGKTFERDVAIGSGFPGWEDIGQIQGNGTTSAAASYTPVLPPQLTSEWTYSGAFNGRWGGPVYALQFFVGPSVEPGAGASRARSYAQVIG